MVQVHFKVIKYNSSTLELVTSTSTPNSDTMVFMNYLPSGVIKWLSRIRACASYEMLFMTDNDVLHIKFAMHDLF